MKFSAAAVLAAAAGVLAGHSNVTYTTEVVSSFVTYCPEATTLSYNEKTYTITEATTFTITDCPCTVTKPVTTSSIVICSTCGYNATAPAKPSATSTTAAVVTAGAGKAAVLSGAGLAGVLGMAILL